MKKLYSLLSAVALCSLSVAAINPSAVLDQNIDRVKATADVVAPAKAPAKAPTGEWTDLGEGTWEDGILPRISAGFRAGSRWTVTVQQSVSDPNWYRLIPYNENSTIAALLDGEAATTYMYINATDPEDVYFEEYTFYDDYTIIALGLAANDGSYNSALYAAERNGKLSEGIITFPERGIAYLSGEYAYYQTSPTKLALPGTTFPAEWEAYGTANMTNAILSPIFAATDDELAGVEVTDISVKRGIEDNNQLRFEGVWSFADSNWPLDLDITDANHVGLPLQGTGIEDEESGYTEIAGVYTGMTTLVGNPLTTAQFDANPDYNQKVIKYDAATNKITFNKNSVFIMWPEGDNPNSLYTWNDQYAYPSTITITPNSGVSNIAVDNSNAPVEFFNLQGIRVENPANGIYIRRQGTNVTKVFVR